MSAYPAAYPDAHGAYAPAPNAYAPAPNAYPAGAPAAYPPAGAPHAYPAGAYPPAGAPEAYPGAGGAHAYAPTTYAPTPVVVVAPPVAPLFIVDTQRKATHQPGQLVYSAKFSRQRLNCLYCILQCPFCCECANRSDQMAQQTHLDVYTNGVLFAQPDNVAHTCDGCCGHEAIGTMRYYDHNVFSTNVTSSGLCYGKLWGCFACQGSFGEQITFFNGCCAPCCKPGGMTHSSSFCNCCGLTETIFGFKEDEGTRLAAIINEQAAIFRSNPAMYRLDPLVANGVDTKYI